MERIRQQGTHGSRRLNYRDGLIFFYDVLPDKLVEDMMKPDRMLKDKFEETLALLEEFRKGIMERA